MTTNRTSQAVAMAWRLFENGAEAQWDSEQTQAISQKYKRMEEALEKIWDMANRKSHPLSIMKESTKALSFDPLA